MALTALEDFLVAWRKLRLVPTDPLALLAGKMPLFVDAWRKMQPVPAEPVALLAMKLPAFVNAWRTIAPTPPAIGAFGPPRYRLTIEALAAMVERLRSALAEARSSGAFFNTWRMGGLGRRELANAGALRRLLDPRGDHGLGAIPLEGLFDALAAVAPSCPRPTHLWHATVKVEYRPMDSVRDRVDLVVDHPDLLLFVEVKVDAVEGRDQLDRYVESAEQLARVTRRPAWRVAFLTPQAMRVTTPDVIELRWRSLAIALRQRLSEPLNRSDARTPILHLLTHFSEL